MARFLQLVVARSDGRSEYQSPGGALAKNEPPRQDTKPLPDGSVDYYVKVENDDPTSHDWRRKLGGMLAKALGAEETHAQLGPNYILKELPEGYVLWKHMRTKATNGKGPTEAPRQDTYLYGYPMGKSRYRSAQEFFPHLLWLATDEQGNCFRNCSCRFCHPEAQLVGDSKRATAITEAPAKPAAQQAPRPAAPPPQANIPKQRTSAPMPTPQQVTALVEKTAEQEFDSDPRNDFIYRPGELVWWHRNPAWGLAVVLRRRKQNGQPQFLLQPLGHPFAYSKPVMRTTSPNDMRPWLAWSVPPVTFGSIKDLHYEQIPWDRILKGDFGKEATLAVEVDASIMAAKSINQSYSFFDRIEVPSAGPSETYYKGMFLGGEKIWLGEPVRLQGVANEEIVVMVIQSMIETMTNRSNVTIVGDIYTFVKTVMPEQYRNRANWPAFNNMPARMAIDLRYRNEVADNAGKNIWREWKLVEQGARKELNDIKGRWYDSKLLLPILRTPQEMETDLKKGEVTDAGLHMNSRVHMMNGPALRKKNRLATIGQAVPPTTKISRGLDGPAEEAGFETPQ